MGYPTKVQLIQRKASEQWYINFPSAVAQAMEFDKGEVVEWIIEDKANLILHRKRTLRSPVKLKKKETPLIDAIDDLLNDVGIGDRAIERVRRHVLSRLVCLGRHTITGLITTFGGQFKDWSAEYRLYARQRIEPAQLFGVIRRAVAATYRPNRPLIFAMDDTQLPRRGIKMPGVKYLRDPMGPPFRVNFVRAQRFIQLSMALPAQDRSARMVPVDFVHAPPVAKPRHNAEPQAWQAYRQQCRARSLAQVGVQRLAVLREQLDADGRADQPLWVSVDGSYTNRTVLRQMPERTVVIGRIRADAKLYNPPGPMQGRGRRRVYGAPLPTPEEIRQDSQIPWIKVEAFAAGKMHAFKIKTIDSVRWRASGPCDLRLIVISPLGYRKTKNGRVLYRKPAYLICTDPQADIRKVLQAYLWRWDIEVNFKEEKSILGIGQAKVRHPESVERVPALAVSAYGLLLVAAARAYGCTGLPKVIPPPKWRRQERARPSTQCLINHLRHELWHKGMNLTHFAKNESPNMKWDKNNLPLESALYYATTAG